MAEDTVLTGKVTAESLRIRNASNTNGLVVGHLLLNDIVTGVPVTGSSFWELRSWTRGGVVQKLPVVPCYASGDFIQVITVPPAGTVIEVVHEITVDSVPYVPALGNPIKFVKK